MDAAIDAVFEMNAEWHCCDCLTKVFLQSSLKFALTFQTWFKGSPEKSPKEIRKCFILFTELNGKRTEKNGKSEFSNQQHIKKDCEWGVLTFEEVGYYSLKWTDSICFTFNHHRFDGGDNTKVRTRFYKLKFDRYIMTWDFRDFIAVLSTAVYSQCVWRCFVNT